MGMYDIIDGVTAHCPQCREKLTGTFQTKDFINPMINHYSIGDNIPKDRDNMSYVMTYTVCSNCGLFTNIFLVVEDDVLTDKMC